MAANKIQKIGLTVKQDRNAQEKKKIIKLADEVKARDGFATFSSVAKELGITKHSLTHKFKKLGLSISTWNPNAIHRTKEELVAVADELKRTHGSATMVAIGNVLNLSRERVRQLFEKFDLDIDDWARDDLLALRSLDITNLTLDEILEKTGYQYSKNSLAALLRFYNRPYAKEEKYPLSTIDTAQYTSFELKEMVKCDTSHHAFTSYLFKHNIPYKHSKGSDRRTNTEALLKLDSLQTEHYTSRELAELIGYQGVNLTPTLKARGLKFKKVIRGKNGGEA